MAEPPKFPGFWSGKNIFGPNPVVESFSYTFPKTFLEGAGLPSNEPFMPPDLTTVEPTDKYSQLERDWQNLQKIPEGTRDIFNRIVSEGAPASIWPVQELFPHIEPRSSSPIRSPFPPTNTTPTTRRMVRALQNPLKVDVPRTPGGGGLFAGLGGLLSVAAPWAAALGLGLPLGMMWPSKISEKQGIVPESGPLTPQQLFKMRNDAEEIQLRQGGVPVIPEVPEWNPQASIPPDFRVNERSMAALSPPVIYNPPPVVPRISREQEIENMLIRDRMENLRYLPGHPLYEAPFEEGTGPMAGAVIPQVETFADIPAIQPGAKVPFVPPTPPAPAITEALKSFTAARGAGEAQRNREQDQRGRALEQAADNRRKNEEKARLESARNKKEEQARINKENRERKAEEQRIASKQAKEEKQRRALEKQMEDMLRQTQETHNTYLRRKAQEEDRRRRAGYGVGAMYT